ncbi:MAG: transposase [Sandaracinaceae bacterium]|nr:transposase [Sandaracinaceae bacterium]
MSFFKKLIGSDPDTHLRKAEELFARGAFGEAKLAFEKARDALPGDRRSERDGVVARIDACRDGIAQNRIAQGLLLRERGERELAKEELRGALEVAADPSLVDRAQAELDDVDRVEVQQANRRVVMTREERIAVLAGSWYEEQASEYAGYGDEFFDALLALDDEDFPVARDGFAAVLAKAEAPIYLILEHAKACTLAGDSEAAVAGYKRFLAALPEGEGGDRRLGAHIQIGSLHGLAGDQRSALDAFQAAVEDFPTTPAAFRARPAPRISGAPAEALEVLELALDRAGASPEWSLLEEIGLTLAETGNGPGATAQLESVLKRFVDRGDAFIPPRTAWRLAALYEEQGRLDRAADVWRMLAERGPQTERARAHGEAGRLLAAIGLDDEAKKMLKRGVVLSEADSSLRADLEPSWPLSSSPLKYPGRDRHGGSLRIVSGHVDGTAKAEATIAVRRDQEDGPGRLGTGSYDALNQVLDEAGFDAHVETLCELAFEPRSQGGRPSLAPGVYFRMLLLGYFEGIESERGICWRCEDSLSLKLPGIRAARVDARPLQRCHACARDCPSRRTWRSSAS